MNHSPFNRLPLLATIVFAISLAVAPPAFSQNKALDMAGLKTMLEGLGYEPEEKAYSDGSKYFRIVSKSSAIIASIDFDLISKNFLTISCGLWPLPSQEDIPSDVLWKALRKNLGLKRIRFAITARTHRFRLLARLDDKHVRPAEVRAIIEEITNVSGDTKDISNPKNWTKAANDNKAAEAKPAKKEAEVKPAEAKKAVGAN
jgi:hypothetical protein